MSREFRRNLKLVAAFHAALVVTIVVCSGWRSHARKRQSVPIPVDFVVELPPTPVEDVSPTPAVSERTAPPVEPERESVPAPAPKKRSLEPKSAPPSHPKAKSKEVQASRAVIARVLDPGKPRKILTPEEIQRMLDAGARPGDHTSAVDDDALGLEMVRQALHNAWTQPTSDDAGNAEAVVEIRLAPDGTVLGRALLKRSGNRLMDASVLQAADAVARIPGLPPDFVARHRTISVLFRVE